MTIATVAATAFCAKEMAITTVATTAICQNLNGYCYCGYHCPLPKLKWLLLLRALLPFAKIEMAIVTAGTLAFLLKKKWPLLQWPLLPFAKIEMAIVTADNNICG